jgi:hypothetical protein
MRTTDIFARILTTLKSLNVRNLFVSLSRLAPNTWWPPSWRRKLSSPNQPPSQHLSAEQIEVRIWAFVVVSVTLILMFIVGALLYSVTFVTQPIKAMAPIDQAYTPKPQNPIFPVMNEMYIIREGQKKGKPTGRIELPTFRLRSDCSATKLSWLVIIPASIPALITLP